MIDLDKTLVRLNAEKDPNYSPYCLRHAECGRMRKVAPFLWQCARGAVHDERTDEEKTEGDPNP